MYRLFHACFVLLCIQSILNGQQVRYVNPAATGINDGTSWQNAFTDLHTAFAQAVSGDSIFLREGLYKPDTGTDRTRFFEMPGGVKLFGGFKGDEQVLAQRHGGLSILSGNIGDLADSTDNSLTILAMVNPDANTLVEAVTFEHGYAFVDTTVSTVSHFINGGAVFIAAAFGSALPVFRNCTFRYNVAKRQGGAVYVYTEQPVEVNPTFPHCRFVSNYAGFEGAGVYATYKLKGASTVQPFNDCLFEANFGGVSGGGVAAVLYDSLSFQFIRDTFTDNVAHTAYGGMFFIKADHAAYMEIVMDSMIAHGNAGGIATGYCIFTINAPILDSCDIKILNSRISGNRRSTFNNGVQPRFSWIVLGMGSVGTVTIENSTFFNDTIIGASPYGFGGGTLGYAALRLQGNRFLNKFNPLIAGPVLYAHNNFFKTISGIGAVTYLDMANNILGSSTNTSEFPGISYTGAIYKMHNNLFINHKYTQTQLTGNFTYDIRNNIVRNCIGTNNQKVLPLPFINGSGMPFENNAFDIPCANLPAGLTCTNGNKYISDFSKLWVNPSQNDFRLKQCSELIHAGSNDITDSFDYAGNVRIIDGTVDIGPYEAPSITENLSIASTPTCSNTGSFQIDAPNACGMLKYAWHLNGQAGTGNSNLQAGEYLVEVIDSLGRAINLPITVPFIDTIIAADQTASFNCGTIQGANVLVQTVSSPVSLTYTWPDGFVSQSPSRSQLGVGSYVVTVSAPSGCADTAIIVVEGNGLLAVLLDANEIDCFGNLTGSVSAQPLSGLAPYTWRWNTSDTIATLSMIGAGSYTVTITDQLGCTKEVQFQLNQPDSLVASFQVQQNSQQSSTDGAIQVTNVIGGTPPYRFVWNTGDTTSLINGLDTGVYVLQIFDGNGCQSQQVFLLGTSSTVAPNQDASAYAILSPNPSSGRMILNYLLSSSSREGSLRFCDLTGREVLMSSLKAQEVRYLFSIEHLPSGVYFWTVIDGAGFIQSGKVMKIE